MRVIAFHGIGLALLLVAGSAAAKDKDPIKVESAKNIKGVQSVVIGSFAVAFITEKTDEAFAGSQYKRAGTITKSKLANVDAPVFQAIADAAYADFQARLTAAGFTIADRGHMLADKNFAKAEFAAPGSVGTVRFGKDSVAKAAYFTPAALGAKGILKSDVGNGEVGGVAGGLAKMGGFGFMQSLRAAGSATAKSYYAVFNHQPLVNIVYVVDFADAQRYGGRYAVMSSVEVKANLAVVEDLSILSILNAKGQPGTLTIAEPIAVGGDFGKLDDTTSGGTTAGNIIGKGIAEAFGSGSNKYQTLTFSAAPDRYRDGAVQATAAANTRLVDRLATLR